jgi:hypothetical protein
MKRDRKAPEQIIPALRKTGWSRVALLIHSPGGAHQPTGFEVVVLGVFAEVGAGDKGLGSGGPGSANPSLAAW